MIKIFRPLFYKKYIKIKKVLAGALRAPFIIHISRIDYVFIGIIY